MLVCYYWLTMLIYGFGTLVVAFNTTAEFEGHTHALDQLRMDYVTGCYLGWRDDRGEMCDRVLAKDVSLQAKEARF